MNENKQALLAHLTGTAIVRNGTSIAQWHSRCLKAQALPKWHRPDRESEARTEVGY